MAKQSSTHRQAKGGNILRVLFLGDVVGLPGIGMCQRHISRLRDELKLDAVVVNGENSTTCGRGINSRSADAIFEAGADVITTGNHVWKAKEFHSRLDSSDNIVRPANYPPRCPGRGYAFFMVGTHEIAVLNLMGRLFLRENVDCPFRTAESQLLYLSSRTNIIFIDFHAEATSEKESLALYLDGKVSAVLGTHTHVQTGDERVLPEGTAFVSDLGRCGALNSCLGMTKGAILEMFLTQMPQKFLVDESPPFVLGGAWVDVDKDSGRAVDIQKLRIIDSE